MKRLIVVLAVALAGCATMTPEAKLEKGFATVEASAITATRLLDTHVISSEQARRVYTIGTIAAPSLKAGVQRLLACRASGSDDCSTAVAEIDMGSGLLLEMEKFLEAQQLGDGP